VRRVPWHVVMAEGVQIRSLSVNHLALATLVREATALPPSDPASRAYLATRAAALGLPPHVLTNLERLWTPQGWRPPSALQDDAASALYWTTWPQ